MSLHSNEPVRDWQPIRPRQSSALTISRIGYLLRWPLTERRRSFHAVTTGSMSLHCPSDQSLGYGVRSLN
ncbi:hypothetical protein SUDANB37_00020 [Streptomyces sp. enrichment culture]